MRLFWTVPTLIIISFGVIAALNNGISPHVFIFNLVILFAFLYLNIYLHEYGHVIAAKLVGIGVKGVIIGNGRRTVWSKTVFNIPVFITNGFVGGVTLMKSIDNHLLKLRYMFFILGGSLFQLLLTSVFYLLFGMRDLAFLYAGGTSISSVFIISNIIMIFSNLLPFHSYFLAQRMASDGLLLLKVPFLRTQELMLKIEGILISAKE